jgi:hypothetical protein
MGRRPATYQQRRSRAFPECGRISGISTGGADTLSRRLQIKPKLRAARAFHGRAILRHGPFFSREAASEGGVLRAVFCGEVSGRYASPSVMEIWAMRDDGPPMEGVR